MMRSVRDQLEYYRDLTRRLGPGQTLARTARKLRLEADRRFHAVVRPRRLSEARLAKLLVEGIADPSGVLDAPLWRHELDDRRRLRSMLEQAEPHLLDRTASDAERVASGRIDLLGSAYRLDPSDPGMWHRDPVSNRHWPVTYFRGIDIGARDRPGDVKLPWEIGRHQYLLPAAKAYWLTGDERYASLVADHLMSWIHANPLGLGIHWWSALEVGVRMVSWTLLVSLLRGSRALRDRLVQAVVRSLTEQLLFLEGHLAEECEGPLNNHALGEAVGLALGGLLLDGLRPADRWRRLGLAVLARELPRQVYSDGFDYEGTTSYQRFVAELVLSVDLAARLRGVHLPAEVSDGLERLARGIVAVAKPSGQSPRLGDADDGRGIFLADAADHWDHRGVAAVVGSLRGRRDWRSVTGPAREWAVWLLGADAASRWNHAPPVGAGPGSIGLREGGVFVCRSGPASAPDATWVFADCGNLGQGPGGPGGHGHEDITSFELSFGSVDVIVDPGTGTYLGSDERRNAFRSTACHNVLQVHDREMADFGAGLFILRDQARPTVHRWESAARADVLVASHDGWERLEPAVNARRTWVLGKPAALVIVDEIDCAVPDAHECVLRFHLGPTVIASPASIGVLRLEHAGAPLAWLIAGDPVNDWSLEPYDYSPRYGRFVPAQRALRRARAGRRKLITWILRAVPAEILGGCIEVAAREAGVAPCRVP